MGGKNSGRKRDYSESAFVKHFERCKVSTGENEEIIHRVGLALWRNLVTYKTIDFDNGSFSFITHDNLSCSISKNGCHAVLVVNDGSNVYTITKTWAKGFYELILSNVK